MANDPSAEIAVDYKAKYKGKIRGNYVLWDKDMHRQ